MIEQYYWLMSFYTNNEIKYVKFDIVNKYNRISTYILHHNCIITYKNKNAII